MKLYVTTVKNSFHSILDGAQGLNWILQYDSQKFQRVLGDTLNDRVRPWKNMKNSLS